MWYVYTMEYYSAIKKNEIMPSATTCMQLDIHTKSERERQISYDYHLYAESKIWHKWFSLWNRNIPVDREQTCGGGWCWARGRMEWEVGVSRFKLICTEWINNEFLLHSTENYIQYSMINHNEIYNNCTSKTEL